jgi:AbrB family looped-hinge helix DNA binding protein
MLMKVFNKGQVVIPAEIRRNLGISIGDMLDVAIDSKHRTVQLKPRGSMAAPALAGSLSRYSKHRRVPTKHQMATALRKGLSQ